MTGASKYQQLAKQILLDLDSTVLQIKRDPKKFIYRINLSGDNNTLAFGKFQGCFYIFNNIIETAITGYIYIHWITTSKYAFVPHLSDFGFPVYDP